ncbi:MAG: CRISPR-associated protein Csn2-St [Tissierellaceae bacterium]
MIEIYFSGKMLFEFKDKNIVQIAGLNEESKRLIVDIYYKVFKGYKFSEVDMEGMNGYYPEIKKDGQIIKKDNNIVIKLTDINDIMEQLSIKSDSILLKYLLSLGGELPVSRALNKVEENLMELSIELDRLIQNKIDMDNVSIITEVSGVDLKKVIKSFVDVNFIDYKNKKKPLWLFKDKDLINLFLNYTRLILEKDNNFIIIIDGIDARIGLDVYKYFIDKLYLLSEKYSNLNIWLIPKTCDGVWVNYEIFDNTYIISDKLITFEDFDITYESICRNYPDNNLPTRFQVLEVLLKILPFHYADKTYLQTKETVILQVFLKLQDNEPLKIKESGLSHLETNFLTSINR